MVRMADIQELADRIAREFRPQRIILFGSHARGDVTADSDVDLMVVIPYPRKSWQMAAQIRARVRPTFPLDLLVRSPEQLHDRLAMGDPFLKEVAARGKVLYEADHT